MPAQLERLAQPLAKSGYGNYLLDVLKEQVLMKVGANQPLGVLVIEPQVFADDRGYF